MDMSGSHEELTGILSREFEIFLALARNHSFRQTAEQFSLSVPSISRLLNELEARLQVTLFDRSCKPMVLTAEGRWLVHELQPGLRRISQAFEAIHRASFVKPYLRIGFIGSFAYDIAPSFIERMLPRLQGMSCLTGGADRLGERLQAQEVDVILTIDPSFGARDFRRHRLLREPSVIIFPRDEKYRQAEVWGWSELAFCGLPFIRNYSSSGGGKLENRHFATHDLDIVSVVHTDSIDTRVRLVARGLGWAIVRPLTLLEHPELLDSLYVFPAPNPGIMRDIYVLARTNVSGEVFSDIINELADILKTETLPRMRMLLPARTLEGIRIFQTAAHGRQGSERSEF